jgi:hypothetical protein
MASSHNRFPEILALSATLALTGCTAAEAIQPPSTPVETNTKASTPTEYFSQGEFIDPCTPETPGYTFYSNESKRELADECSSIYKAGRVALVNYNVPLPVAEKLAEKTEYLISAATNDYINLDIHVVEPSQEARDMFQAANPDNCMDLEDTEQYGSAIANFVMPEILNESDYVVGLTPATDCLSPNPHTGRQGISSPLLGNRFLEVLDADPAASHPEGEMFADDALILTHELLHNLGLGHAGILQLPRENNPIALDALTYESSIELDLDALITTGYYDEYGDSINTQGNGAMSFSDTEIREKTHNRIQRERLHWPDYLTQSDLTPNEQIVGSTETLLDTSNPDAFASVELPTPVKLNSGPNTPTHSFSKFAVLPSEAIAINEQGSVEKIYRTDLYLTNKEGDTVRLGQVPSTTPHWNLLIGGKIVSINFSDTGVALSATAQ